MKIQGTEIGSRADRRARHRRRLAGRRRGGTGTGYQHKGRGHGHEHQARGGRRRVAGADHRAPEMIQAGANNAMDVLNLISANNTSGSVNFSNSHRPRLVRQPDGLVARPGRAIHASAHQRQAPRLLRRRNLRHRGGQSFGDPDFGHRQGRGADRRRLRNLRQRRNRRRDQLHHAPGLHGCRCDGSIRCADAQWGRRTVDTAGHAGRGRPEEGQVQRLSLDPVPGTEIPGPEGPQFLEHELHSRPARPDVGSIRFRPTSTIRQPSRSSARLDTRSASRRSTGAACASTIRRARAASSRSPSKRS